MPGLFCLHETSMGPATGNCSQYDPLIMDGSQSLHTHSELNSHCRSRWGLSLKHSHAHVQPNKSCPALCRSWAIIVCQVQLHLKWQHPRATRIKDRVQSNTPFTSCQRGCTAPLFLPSHFLFICQTQKRSALLLPVLHKDCLIYVFISLHSSACLRLAPASFF